MVTKQKIVLSGEVFSKSEIDVEKLIETYIKDIGYKDSSLGFDYSKCFIRKLHPKKQKIKK
jgi:S-adenosylmethionine synthetase